jgi:hypothetical protein
MRIILFEGVLMHQFVLFASFAGIRQVFLVLCCRIVKKRESRQVWMDVIQVSIGNMEQEQVFPNFDAGIAQDQAREKDAPENRTRPWNGRNTS